MGEDKFRPMLPLPTLEDFTRYLINEQGRPHSMFNLSWNVLQTIPCCFFEIPSPSSFILATGNEGLVLFFCSRSIEDTFLSIVGPSFHLIRTWEIDHILIPLPSASLSTLLVRYILASWPCALRIRSTSFWYAVS